MRSVLSVLALGILLAHSSSAQAGLFGGFASDGSYLRGRDKVCQPVSKQDEATSCQERNAAIIATLNLTKGERQRGPGAIVEIHKSGTTIEVRLRADGTSLFVWESGNVVSTIAEAYLDPKGQQVAVEYSSRFGGRLVDELVVMRLANAVTPPVPVAPPKPDTPAPGPVAGDDAPEFTKAMAAAAKWEKKRKHKQTIAALETALGHSPLHPEALYRLARAQMASKNKTAALATLSKLPTSTHPQMGRWRVEARFDKVFKSLRLDPSFRSAVGIERKAGDAASAYERFVGLGGRWEQAAIPCEQAEVDLELKRDAVSRFDLVIRSKCQGSIETTRLDGRWAVHDDQKLKLQFPNTDSDDENLLCELERCADSSGEDCLRCKWDTDEILFRTVRR